MGYIREPEGIDFIINGRPLTAAEDKAISEFIKADRAKNSKFVVPARKSREQYAMA
ncbi:MAG: hypothetical protein LBV75_09880 [Paludibacter sp.]|jgi:hypothetical protein|nr:hypothetical protein [Paludibacter sp.]